MVNGITDYTIYILCYSYTTVTIQINRGKPPYLEGTASGRGVIFPFDHATAQWVWFSAITNRDLPLTNYPCYLAYKSEAGYLYKLGTVWETSTRFTIPKCYIQNTEHSKGAMEP